MEITILSKFGNTNVPLYSISFIYIFIQQFRFDDIFLMVCIIFFRKYQFDDFRISEKKKRWEA